VPYALFFGAVFAIGAFNQWRFKTGWQVTSGRMQPTAFVRDVYITLLYTALPMMVVAASGGALFVLTELFEDSRTPVAVQAVIGLIVVFAGASVWLMKEFLRPTRSRTPTWLRDDPWYNTLRGR